MFLTKWLNFISFVNTILEFHYKVPLRGRIELLNFQMNMYYTLTKKDVWQIPYTQIC